MVKLIVKKLISIIVNNEFCWRLFNSTIMVLADYGKCERDKGACICKASAIRLISPNLAVLHGPFAGMRYPVLQSFGSSFPPKIIGSYERELHHLIEKFCRENYTEIIDIGCAEGYYAIGLAMRIKTAKVYAFDSNSEAIESCKLMAEINNVSDRIVLGTYCDEQVLSSLRFAKKALIISDCEGFEKKLFTRKIASILADHDLLIEIHDFIDNEISTTIRANFHQTHTISSIRSISDDDKVNSYHYDEINGFNEVGKRRLLAERRSTIMEWYYLTPRHIN